MSNEETGAGKTKRKYTPRKPKTEGAIFDAATLLSTPQAQSVIAAAVAAAVAELAKKGADAEPSEGKDDLSIVRSLAVAINELSDQGNKSKRVPAAELERRKAANEQMSDLIEAAKAQDMAPEYYVNRMTFLNEEMISPTFVGTDKVQRRTKIVWRGIPNEAMEPVEGSQIAVEIFAAFIESIGGRTPHAHRANYTLDGKTVKEGELVVLHKGLRSREPHPVGRARGGVEHIGRHMPGEIVETNVLGTIHAPARQTA